jgi:hypothetical protein
MSRAERAVGKCGGRGVGQAAIQAQGARRAGRLNAGQGDVFFLRRGNVEKIGGRAFWGAVWILRRFFAQISRRFCADFARISRRFCADFSHRFYADSLRRFYTDVSHRFYADSLHRFYTDVSCRFYTDSLRKISTNRGGCCEEKYFKELIVNYLANRLPASMTRFWPRW